MSENPDLRAADADRDATIGRLRDAHAEGRLDPAEFDERMTAALSARTFGELDALVADLPGAGRPATAPVPRGAENVPLPRRPGHLVRDLRRWAATSVTLWAIWLVAFVASPGHRLQGFWPLWVMGIGGAGLARAIRGDDRGDDRHRAERDLHRRQRDQLRAARHEQRRLHGHSHDEHRDLPPGEK